MRKKMRFTGGIDQNNDCIVSYSWEPVYGQVMVPGTIPSAVKPLQSRAQGGVIPRYQQALVRFFNAKRIPLQTSLLIGFQSGRIASGARGPAFGSASLCPGGTLSRGALRANGLSDVHLQF